MFPVVFHMTNCVFIYILQNQRNSNLNYNEYKEGIGNDKNTLPFFTNRERF